VHILTNLFLRNQVHHIVALIAENALKLTNAYLYFKNFLWTKNPVQQNIEFNTQISLKVTCEQISFQKFSGASPGPPFKGQGREGRRGRRNREERKGEGIGWEGKEGSITQIKFYYYCTLHG
jgi:hypothetical protein